MWEDVRRCEKIWEDVYDEKMWRWEDVSKSCNTSGPLDYTFLRLGYKKERARGQEEKMWDEKMWEDVRRCEKMWEDVRRCEKMWRWEDVKMRRCEKMWRWEDVKMRRCEDEKMWRWEDVLQTPTIGRTLRSDALGKNGEARSHARKNNLNIFYLKKMRLANLQKARFCKQKWAIHGNLGGQEPGTKKQFEYILFEKMRLTNFRKGLEAEAGRQRWALHFFLFGPLRPWIVFGVLILSAQISVFWRLGKTMFSMTTFSVLFFLGSWRPKSYVFPF